MRIADFLRPELVVPGLHAQDPRGAIGELLRRLQGDAEQLEALEQALWQRELAHTTSLRVGVAVPHTTAPTLLRPILCVGTSARGIFFGPEPVLVHVLFLLLSPAEQTQLHVKLLARIARVSRRTGFVEDMVSATTAAQVLDAIERAEFDV